MSLPKLASSSLALRIPLSALASLSVPVVSSVSASSSSNVSPTNQNKTKVQQQQQFPSILSPYLFQHLQSRIHQLYTHIDSSPHTFSTFSSGTKPLPSSIFPPSSVSLRNELVKTYHELQPFCQGIPTTETGISPSLYHSYTSTIYPILSTLSQSIITYIDTFRDPIQKYSLHYYKPLSQYLNRIFLRSIGISTINNSLYDAINVRTLDSTEAAKVRSFVRKFSIMDMIHTSTADISAFCVEKYGAVPQVRITNSCGTPLSSSSSSSTLPSDPYIIGIPSYIQYAYVELLKNAMRTMLDRYTTLGIDDAPPIEVHVSLYNQQQLLVLRIEDSGNGIILPTEIIKDIPNKYAIVHSSSPSSSSLSSLSPNSLSRSTITNRSIAASFIVGSLTQFPYYSSTAFTREENNYQYSREFGVSFTGQGLGLIRSQLYSQLHNGTLELFSIPNKGTTALFCIDTTGSSTDTQVYERLQYI